MISNNNEKVFKAFEVISRMNNLKLRIENVDSYLEFGEQLEARVEEEGFADPKFQEIVSGSLETLRSLRQLYKRIYDHELESVKSRAQADQRGAESLDLMASFYGGDYELAKKRMEELDKTPRSKRFLQALGKVVRFSLQSMVSASFSRERSKYYSDLCRSYSKTMSLIWMEVGLERENQRLTGEIKLKQQSLVQNTMKKEAAELKTFNKLISFGVREDVAQSIATSPPENLCYFMLNLVNEHLRNY